MTRAGEEEGGVAGWLGEGWGIDHTAGEGLTHTHPKAPLANSAWRARTVPRPRSSASCPPPPSDASTPTPQVLPIAQEYRSKNHSRAPRECQRVHCGVRGAAAHTYRHTHTCPHETLGFAVRQQVVPKVYIYLFTATSSVWDQCLVDCLHVLPGDRPTNPRRSTRNRMIEEKLTSRKRD